MTRTVLFLNLFALACFRVAADPVKAGGAGEAEAAFGAERPRARTAVNVSRDTVWTVAATPGKIFPLLCPVLEYDWIPGWRAQLLHAPSGAAEENCIFETRFAPYGRMTWICTRYEPARRIEYTSFSEHGLIVRLTIILEAIPNGTRVSWHRAWLSLNPSGDEWLKRWNAAHYEEGMSKLEAHLVHYLRTGTLPAE